MPIQTAADSISNSAGSPYGFKNRIINGAMAIDQRNSGSSTTPSGDAYNLDRWQAASGTAGSWFTFQQSNVVPANFTYSLSILSTGANSVSSGSIYVLQQRIEGYNVADLGYGSSDAKPITISFWIRGSVTGTYGLVVTNGAMTRAYPITYTINSANTWEYKIVTISGDTSGTWLKDNGIGMRLVFQLGTGSSNTLTAGTGWVTPSGGAYGVTGTTNLSATNAATLYITGVQVEKGSQATAFDYRDYGNELRLCQRYYYQRNIISTSTDYIAVLQCFNTGGVYGKLFDLPVTMRATPTGSMSSITHFRASTSGGNGTTSFSAGSIDVLSPAAVGTQGWSGISGLTGGNATVITASTVPSWIAVSAEL